MRRRGARWVRSSSALAVLLAAAIAGCGEEDVSFNDARIVEALKLEDSGEGYIIGGDPFCVLSDRFFNDSGEVTAAQGTEEAGVVVASRTGNVGVEGVPPFAPDCKQTARKRLDKLDPPPPPE